MSIVQPVPSHAFDQSSLGPAIHPPSNGRPRVSVLASEVHSHRSDSQTDSFSHPCSPPPSSPRLARWVSPSPSPPPRAPWTISQLHPTSTITVHWDLQALCESHPPNGLILSFMPSHLPTPNPILKQLTPLRSCHPYRFEPVNVLLALPPPLNMMICSFQPKTRISQARLLADRLARIERLVMLRRSSVILISRLPSLHLLGSPLIFALRSYDNTLARCSLRNLIR